MPSKPGSPARLRAQKKYNAKPSQIKARVNRNKARRKMIKAGKAKVGDGKDVAHKDNNHNNNKRSNLKTVSRSKNRSYKRTKSGKMKK